MYPLVPYHTQKKEEEKTLFYDAMKIRQKPNKKKKLRVKETLEGSNGEDGYKQYETRERDDLLVTDIKQRRSRTKIGYNLLFLKKYCRVIWID
jgi:hypothetical protein